MQELVALARALGDPTRLKLLRILVERECSVHELVDILAMGQSRVSQHLARLKAAGLVQERRAGREVLYAARPQAVFSLDQALTAFFRTPVEALPEMRAEWQRWRAPGPGRPAGSHAAGGAAGGGPGDGTGLPVVFRPEPADRGAAAARPGRRPRVLFLCTANSFRSQIAEAWARVLAAGRVEAASAGLEPTRVHPVAEAVMREVGVDLSSHYAKAVTPAMLAQADVVITLCGGALAWFPITGRGIRREHWPLADPTGLDAPDEVILSESRRVRDRIRHRVEGLLASLEHAS